VTNDGRLFHARAAATGKAPSPIVFRRVAGTMTTDDELERKTVQHWSKDKISKTIQVLGLRPHADTLISLFKTLDQPLQIILQFTIYGTPTLFWNVFAFSVKIPYRVIKCIKTARLIWLFCFLAFLPIVKITLVLG